MIKRQSSINKIFHEKIGQRTFFGRDNLLFKTINMSKKQRFDNICEVFKLKKHVKKKSLCFLLIEVHKT